jgi:predicted nucleotidyltransferase component of viral defense system
MLHYNTITPLLHSILADLMSADVFKDFRLVGGTALSLHRGHRMSVDIDLFTDAEYGSVDFNAIDTFLRSNYSYVDTIKYDIIGMGKCYFIGDNQLNCIKLDLFYTDKFIDKTILIDGLRLASIEEIIAMKMDVILRTGRKKDFWDIHELKDNYSISEMIALHEKRYPYTHDRDALKQKFIDFEYADGDFEPDCLRGKHWEFIKLDLIDFIKEIK